MQRLWECGLSWDGPVPTEIYNSWERWHSDVLTLKTLAIPRGYFPVGVTAKSLKLHGFSDASEVAYAVLIYLRITGCNDSVSTSLVIAKTKVAQMKCVTVPRLELCGAVLVARLLHHVAKVLKVPGKNIYAGTNGMVVLSCLHGNPR